jgi:hypothetical protein
MASKPMAWHGHRLDIMIAAADVGDRFEWSMRLGQEIERSKEIRTLAAAVQELASEIDMTATVALRRHAGEHVVTLTFERRVLP